ncbi:MAG: NnrS family protein [Rhodospirillaceae bacterium]|nr:NnrS family protein [Rhodospirillaceae bacterium]MBT4220570.1 NnrS family protein [Rhodospirillaceae bacterium]MBT5014056.1 NnrS family protein [Rhodospirillaceae bacterium]MBT5309476.1 NnrS family protein [Rhodospirillaceae bacterium]MBT6406578.1 NnrS family protein [Rhodospirillaceae bacterium]
MFAGLYGMAPMVFWLMVSSGEGYVPGPLPPIYWHGHEMLFGFAIAAVCGFMLTAVPNWTRTPPVAGPVLMVLAGLWLAGRIAFWVGWDLGAMPVAVIDLMLIPALGIVAGGRIISAGLQRNFVFIGLLTVLFASNLLMHLQAIGVTTDTAEMGLRLGIYGFVLLVTLIAGRIVPNFTSGALRMDAVPAEASTPPAIEKLVVLTLLAAIVADLAGDAVPQMVTAAMQLLASASLLVRMRNWQTLKTLGQPIVWVLHLGHLWLVVGFALLGLSGIIGHPGEGAALHALTAGAIGTMILAVMTRAALGHSGRQLHASKPIVVAYVLVSIGALLRVLTPYLGFQAVIVGGVLWTLAFVIFTIAFWPILTRPRT